MNVEETCVYVLLLGVGLVLTGRYVWWWFSPERLPSNGHAGEPAGLILSLLPFVGLTLLEALRNGQVLIYWVFASFMADPVPMAPPKGMRIALLTTIVPSAEPLPMLAETLRAMKRVRYSSPVDVWVLDEEDDPRVRALAARLGVHHFSRHGIEAYNQDSGPFATRTKAGNHNAWGDCHHDEYDIVAQMDPDHVPTEDFLEKTVGYFSDPDIAFVVAPQVYYRNSTSNWIARGADEQNFAFSAIIQRGANTLGVPILIGSNHVVRAAAMRQIGGYASHIVEDHLTGMVMYASKNPMTGRPWKGVYTSEIVSLGEGPTTWTAFLRQQMRWSYGLFEIVKVHTWRLLGRMTRRQAIGLLAIQSYYFSSAVIYGLGLVLTTAHLLFGLDAIHMQTLEFLRYWLPLAVMQILMWLWLQRFYLRAGDRGFAVRGMLVVAGATLIYLRGLIASASSRKLPYVVTAKREGATRDPLRCFDWHLASLLLSLAGLAWALTEDSGAWSIRMWAAVNVVTMVAVVWTGVRTRRRTRRLAPPPRETRGDLGPAYWARLAVPVLALATVTAGSSLGIGAWDARGAADVTLAYATGSHMDGPPPPPPPPVDASFLRPGDGAVAFGAFDPGGQMAGLSMIRHEFVDFRPERIPEFAATIAAASATRQIALITWEPRRTSTFVLGPTPDDMNLLLAIAAGDEDTYLREVARAIAASNETVILRFAAEMDFALDGLHPWSDHPEAEYIAAWRQVREIFESEGATNALFLWSPGGVTTPDGVFQSDRWYPGDDVVDLVGFSAYTFWIWDEWDAERAAKHLYRSPAELILPRYDAISRHGKPVVLPEVGMRLHASRQAEEGAWLDQLISLLASDRAPLLVAAVYFHAPHNLPDYDVDWRLDEAQLALVRDAILDNSAIQIPGRRLFP